MRKLLRADFARLKESKTFWIGILGMVLICAALLFDHWGFVRKYGEEAGPFEEVLFNYAPMIGFFCTMIVGMVLGADYNDGTIRNKLIVGHERLNIYLSHLIVSFAVGAALQIAFLVPALAIGLLLSNGFKLPLNIIIEMILFSFCTALAFASISAAIGMCVQNRTAAVIAGVAVILIMFVVAAMIGAQLDEPEMTYAGSFVITSEDGIIQEPELVPNPRYLTGVKRTVYQWIDDILPMGQSIQIADGSPGDFMWRWPFTAAGVILLSSSIGYAIFKRKDIK